jgi:prepilin-type N-terminal cleavage/methylation domain-containing protein
MVKTHTHARANEAGFTLVELAIVMIIIGLLIGGILKGQELIGNARIKSTISQLKGVEAATSSFRDAYNAMPGDMATPNTRLPNCLAAPCNAGGNGDGQVVSPFTGAPTAEGQGFFVQLSAANLLTGIVPTVGAGGLVWGANLPVSPIGGGLQVGFFVGNAPLSNQQGPAIAGNVAAGHYLALHNAPAAGMPAAGTMSATAAARIDRAIDDGVPNTGIVLAAGAGACAAANLYTEATQGNTCNIYVKVQN